MQNGLNYIASNLNKYGKRWVFFDPKESDQSSSSSEGVSSHWRQDTIETTEKLFVTFRKFQ